MIAKTHRWLKTTMAVAAMVLLSLSGSGAYALSLGRLTVKSALGEPLRAEIDIPDITQDEAASLKAALASPEAFVAAGLEYSPALSSLQISLQQLADGRSYLRLTSDRPVNDPFVDLILQATWSSGRIVRDYTLLLDPPSLTNPTPAPTLAQTPASANGSATTLPPAAPLPKATTSEPAPIAKPAPTPAPPAKAITPTAVASEEKQVTVKQGDTASKIANANKPSGVSLDQMLVALLRSNPEAFVKDNLNRVRAGAVLTMPSSENAASVPPAEASKIVVAQSKDFNSFRRNLAANAAQTTVNVADRKASGLVEAKVDDKKPTPPAPDKLTLSKGALSAKTDEAKIAKEREAKDAAVREAELAKNKKELESLKAAVNALPAKPASPQVPPGITVPVAATPPAAEPSQPAAAKAASTPTASASAPQAVASAASAKAPVKEAMPAPAEEGSSLLDTLLEDPLVPAGAAGLLVLLGGFAIYSIRRRKKKASQIGSAFLESRLQPDSFFGASGGQRVDTNHNDEGDVSSMVYTASQLDQADDVDPVAEADVYLAYGRDLQAEEILKEAIRSNPGRVAIHTKLLEIFAKRRDIRSFESTASQAYKLKGAGSPEWARICELGKSIDPNNPMYQPGGTPTAPPNFADTAVGASSGFGSHTEPQTARAELTPDLSGGVDLDLDLDLDFSLDEEPTASKPQVTRPAFSANPTKSVNPQAPIANNGRDLDFDMAEDEPRQPNPSRSPIGQMPEISLSLDSLETPLDATQTQRMPFERTSATPLASAASTTPTPLADTGMMEFDLSSLSMELDNPASSSPSTPDALGGDPLGTKLALAEEFISIGDADGARALIEEVLSEATGAMRAKAQKALAQLR